jgi:hypothetical protein
MGFADGFRAGQAAVESAERRKREEAERLAIAEAAKYDPNANLEADNQKATAYAAENAATAAQDNATFGEGTAAPTDYQYGQAPAGRVRMPDALVNQERTNRMATAYEQSGNTENAMRLRSLAQKQALTGVNFKEAGIRLKAAEQGQADSDELRQVLSGAQATRAVVRNGIPVQGESNGDVLDDFLKNTAPRAVATLLKQGKLVEAKRYQDFISSEQGQKYAGLWASGVRKHSVGDSAGALADFEKLYNSQMYNDGRTAKLTPLNGGKQYRLEAFDSTGAVIESQVADTDQLTKGAAMYLAPTKAVEFHAQQEAQREKEGALLDRQIQIKQLDIQQGENREDRRDGRTQMVIGAADKRLSKRLDAGGGGDLTLPQQRTNESIDAARRQLAGMSQADVLAVTQASTATGRANPAYDPEIARIAKMANTRKYGDDTSHDAFTAGPRKAPASDRTDVAKRFRADPGMNAYTLGKETPGGIEVLQKGRVVGHYR